MILSHAALLRPGIFPEIKKSDIRYLVAMTAFMVVIVLLRYVLPGYKNVAALFFTENILLLYLFYLVPFLGAFFLQSFFYSGTLLLSSRWFWILTLAAPAIFTFRVIAGRWQGETTGLPVYAIIFLKTAMLVIPAAFLWSRYQKPRESFFGLKIIDDVKPYLFLLLLILPLVITASVGKTFAKHYPYIFHFDKAPVPHHVPEIILSELSYGLDLAGIEFFFRGFLVIAFVKVCGSRAILPAAIFYCCIHFGKPMPEAIGSFFGALMLGIVSYRTKSIMGGIIIHIGIAWSMEVLAWGIRH